MIKVLAYSIRAYRQLGKLFSYYTGEVGGFLIKLSRPKITGSPSVKRYRDQAFLKKLGMRVKQLRRSKGYSMDRLALESEGLNRSSLSRIESGTIDPQISTLKRIAETIGVPLQDLIKVS